MTRKLSSLLLSTLLSGPALSSAALAQDNPNPGAPAAAPTPGTASVPGDASSAAAPAAGAPANPTQGAAATAQKKKGGSGPALGLNPEAPQVGGLVTSPAEVVAPPTEESTGEWKFDVTGYFRAPLRFSWGPPDDTRRRRAATRERSSVRRRWCRTPTTSTGATPTAWSGRGPS